MFYPAFIDLENRPVLVVGGGVVAERKVETLLETGALVTVVSPEITDLLLGYSQSKRITVRQRGFIPSDIDGVWLVISATDDPVTQSEVASIAASKNILVNTVDKPELCSFIVPAILRRGDITIAISTSGKSPSLAAELRTRLDRVLTNEIARTAEVLGAVRQEVHQHFTNSDDRKKVFDSIIGSGIVEWIAGYDDAAALDRVRQMIREMIEKPS
jgi:precorrin-2 dehydrogenase/sirohydrochlorin ferrochelatase